MGFNMYSSRKTRNQYAKLTEDANKDVEEIRDTFDFHSARLIEEIELLKTNEGLYNLRSNEEQYQMYLSLLRKK